MTEVSFHFNVPDRAGYACRLLRKAVRRGARVVVAAPSQVLGALDRQLWVFEPLDFVPHVHAKPGQPVAPRLQATPVWLTERVLEAPHHEVLLNLGDELVEGFETFERVIELVSADGPDRQAGRARWKHYTDRGYVIARHDVAQEASA
ncbi:MAG TPA: DNA polymerase III subunit chi [Rhizobacter sp.]|jgi:DNA polymerase-3 subunit chi|nr:DNA polymerase III subunit chi [Rhizobacter sp.]